MCTWNKKHNDKFGAVVSKSTPINACYEGVGKKEIQPEKEMRKDPIDILHHFHV